MSDSPVFKCLPVIVRDKVVSSHTSGSVTASGQGRNVSVSNTVSTVVVLDVVLEFPDGIFCRSNSSMKACTHQ